MIVDAKRYLQAGLIAGRNLAIGVNLVSLSLIFRPARFVDVVSTLLFYFKALTGHGRLEQRNPQTFFKYSREYEILIDTDHYFWGNDPSYTKDIVTLCVLPKLMDAKRIFEIGTLDGFTAEHFAMNSLESTEVFTLDLPFEGSKLHLNTTLMDDNHRRAHSAVEKYRFDNTSWVSKVHLLFGDSASYDFSVFYDSIDLFFIDGAHSYEYVKSDTLNAIRCCRDGGMVVWHDYGRMGVNGVTRFLHEFSANGHRIYSVPGSSLAYHFVSGSAAD